MYHTILAAITGILPMEDVKKPDNPFDGVNPSADALGSDFTSLVSRALGAFWWIALTLTAFFMIYAIIKFVVGSRENSPHEVNKGKKALVGVVLGVIMLVGMPLWMDVAINFIG